jgi:hypothetical protein
VFENRVLRRILGSMRGEVTGEWRKLHNEEPNGLFSSPNVFSGDKIEKSEKGGVCSACGGGERLIRGLVGKPEGKRPLGGPRRRWEDNINMEVRCGGTDWIKLAQDRDR